MLTTATIAIAQPRVRYTRSIPRSTTTPISVFARRTTPPESSARTSPYGVIVEQVILGNFAFKPDHQNLINRRKEAEKQAEKLEAEILATLESKKANLQLKVAELTEQLTRAEGEFEQAKRAADA